MKTKSMHSFHIPVMGLAYTIDSPIRVAQYGISSVISVMDDELIERMNRFYSEKFELPYQEIGKKVEDFRAKRITAYLNTVDTIVKKKFQQLKTDLLESKKAITHYMELLPEASQIREDLQLYLQDNFCIDKLKATLDTYLKPGEIDVNIMTKVDRDNFDKKKPLPIAYNDAHAALRGFAASDLHSSVVLSAGMNPRLFSYFEQFDDFYPDEHQGLQKKIILKVSDFRSALIQGNFLAKKGLWVSEYRIESGLNCGGHAFATEGFLLGPILEEFKARKEELITSTHDLMCKALEQKGKCIPATPLELKITAQGGVGTAKEHQFLLSHYEVDSVGWGSPFLLVPEATSVDAKTRNLLAQAGEEDLYLSDISPLGVPFNNIKGTTNESLRTARVLSAKVGSSCPRKYLALDKSVDEQGLCTASRKYQQMQLNTLEATRENLSETEYKKQFEKITEKACLCIGLANASFLEHELPIKGEAQGVVICPGPNIAYFSEEVSLNQMVGHIYGRANVMHSSIRPNFLIKELRMYRDHFQKEKALALVGPTPLKTKKLQKLKANIQEGIAYYKKLFTADTTFFTEDKSAILEELNKIEAQLN